jgi:hypothetical protein
LKKAAGLPTYNQRLVPAARDQYGDASHDIDFENSGCIVFGDTLTGAEYDDQHTGCCAHYAQQVKRPEQGFCHGIDRLTRLFLTHP